MKQIMFKSIKVCAVNSQQVRRGEDNGPTQDDDIESKDFEGENGKGSLAENNGQIVT